MSALVPNGYRLIIPPGWVRIPLRHGTDEALEDLVFSRLKELPPEVSKDDGMKYRLMLRRVVTRQVGEARSAGGLDLYLPLTTRYGVPLAASFLASEHRSGTSSVDQLRAQLAQISGQISTHTLAGSSAVRREHVQPPEPAREVHVPTRRVEYLLPVPGDARRVVTVVFATPGDGLADSPFTTALAELFDASMLTFRWTRDGVDLATEPVANGQD